MTDRLLMVLMLLKSFLSVLMKTVQLPDAEAYDSHVVIHASTVITEISSARGFQKISQTQQGHMAC